MNTDQNTPPPAYENNHDTKTSLPEQSAPLLNEPGSNSVIPGQQEIKINPLTDESNVQNLEIQDDDRYDNSKSACYNFRQKMCQCYGFRDRSSLYKWSCVIIPLAIGIEIFLFILFLLYIYC